MSEPTEKTTPVPSAPNSATVEPSPAPATEAGTDRPKADAEPGDLKRESVPPTEPVNAAAPEPEPSAIPPAAPGNDAEAATGETEEERARRVNERETEMAELLGEIFGEDKPG